MALSHANKAMLNRIRTDGNTWQEVICDLFTGAVISRGQREGYSNTSTWARGQAWDIYGFTLACQQTTSFSFLAALKSVPTITWPMGRRTLCRIGIGRARDCDHLEGSSAPAITLPGLVQMSLLATNLSIALPIGWGPHALVSGLHQLSGAGHLQ